MRKNIGLVLIVTLICAMLLSACGKEVVATTDPVPTEPAVTTTTSADEAVTEAPKPEVKTEVEDVKPTEEVFKSDEGKINPFDYVKDGVFYYHDYAKAIGDETMSTIGENPRTGAAFVVGDWSILLMNDDYDEFYSYLAVGKSDRSNTLGTPIEYAADDIGLYDEPEGKVPKKGIELLPMVVDYCATHSYSDVTPDILSDWKSMKEIRMDYLAKKDVDVDLTPSVEIIGQNPPEPSISDEMAPFVRDGLFYYHEYAESVGDYSGATFSQEPDKSSRIGCGLFVNNDIMIYVTTTENDPQKSYILVWTDFTTYDYAWAIELQYGDDVGLYDKPDAKVPLKGVEMLPTLVEYCKTHNDFSKPPTVYDGWFNYGDLLK
jgi:hypothetical protein